jgi:hypothetical protein
VRALDRRLATAELDRVRVGRLARLRGGGLFQVCLGVRVSFAQSEMPTCGGFGPTVIWAVFAIFEVNTRQ